MEAALADDIPVIIDPPATPTTDPEATPPADPELQNLAAQVAQVTNLEDLDDLLAETLFGNAELEQLSTEIKAREDGDATPQAPTSAAQQAAPAPQQTAPAQPQARPNDQVPPGPAADSDDAATGRAERLAILAAMERTR